ncbi:MAG: phosphatase domain-containing protein, partial [Anaerolineales bacterium]
LAQDKAIHAMVRLCNLLYASGIQIILCSGRHEHHRAETVNWLAQQGVSYHDLLLRKDSDHRSDTVVKREILATIDKTKVLFVVEDRSQVVEMWRSEGLVCLQCAPGEF